MSYVLYRSYCPKSKTNDVEPHHLVPDHLRESSYLVNTTNPSSRNKIKNIVFVQRRRVEHVSILFGMCP